MIIPEVLKKHLKQDGVIVLDGDKQKGLAVLNNKSRSYSAPLIHFAPFKENFLLRIYNSIGERDDTNKKTWNGKFETAFSFLGHKNDINTIRQSSNCLNNPPILID